MNPAPLVSFIITAFNYERYVEDCILSCLNQNGSIPFEVLLIDDGSSDSTLRIARKYEDRIRIFSGPNGGIESASNRGIGLATADHIVRVDADDLLHPDFLSVMGGHLPLSKWSFVYSDYLEVDGTGRDTMRITLPPFDKNEIKARGDFLATGTLYRRDHIMKYGPYNTKIQNCGLENYELILHLLAEGRTGFRIPQPLFGYRIHQDNMSLVRREKILQYGQTLADRFALGSYRTNSFHPYKLKT